MENTGALRFEPMIGTDLDWVAEQERALHVSPWSRKSFQDSFAAGHSAWMARAGQTAAGYALMMYAPDEATLLNITIARTMQGNGRGKCFLRFLIEQAERHPVERMLLEVRASNHAALALYRSCGFIEIGRRKGYYRSGQQLEDAIVMQKSLP